VKHRWWLIAGGLGAALLVALVALPAFIDWQTLKPEVAGRLEAALGRRVAIDGPLSLTLLPVPSARAKGVRIANLDGTADPDMAVIPSLQARLDLSALLHGRLEVASLVLGAPVVHLQRLPDGRANWQFTPNTPVIVGQLRASRGVAPEGARSTHTSAIERLEVEDGTVVYRMTDGAEHRLDGIDGQFSLNATGNSFAGTGSVRYGESAFTFSGSLGLGSTPAPASLRVSAAGKGGGDLQLTGQWRSAAPTDDTSGDWLFKGKLSIKSPDGARLAALFHEWGEAILPAGKPLTLDTAVTLSASQLQLEGLSLGLAAMQATGSLRASLNDPPAVDLTLAFGRLDVDQWLSPAPTAPAAAPAAAAVPLPVGSRSNGHFALPRGLSVKVDLGANAVIYRGTVMRGARLNLALTNGELTVNQASVALPGDSQVTLFGFLVADGGQPSFDGSFEAATDDLRTLLDWFKLDVQAVPPDRLNAARLTAQVKANPRQITVDSARLVLDATRINAKATLQLQDRPKLAASFAVDNLNADAYWPAAATARAAVQPAAGQPAAAQPAPGPAASPVSAGRWTDKIDADLSGQIGQLIARGVTARQVSVDASWLRSVLSLRSLSVADIAGGHLQLGGTVAGLTGAEPLAVHDLHYALDGGDPARLLHLFGVAAPPEAGRWAPLALTGRVAGNLERLSIDSRSQAGGATLNLSGTMTSPLTAPGVELSLDFGHPNLSQFLGLLDPGYRPPATGALTVGAKLAGDLGRLRLDNLRLAVGPLSATGEATVSLAGKPKIEATLAAGEVPVDAFLPPRHEADATPAAKTGMTAATAPPARFGIPVEGALPGAPRPLVRVAQLSEPWSRQPLDLAWMTGFDADLTVKAAVLLRGTTRFDNAQFHLRLADGKAGLDQFACQLYGGALTASGRFDASGGAELQAKLQHARAGEALMQLADLSLAEGSLDAEADLATSGLSVAEMIGRLGGSGRLAVTDGDLRGFDLKAADERLGHPDQSSLLSLFQAGLTGGHTRFSNLSGSFRVGNGIVASDDLSLAADGGSATGAAQVNLPGYALDAHFDFRLADAPQAPPLVLRLNGSLDDPRKVLDINPLQHWLAERGQGRQRKQ
jgi:uncharacterized protein involved in outer membrane biogenesis